MKKPIVALLMACGLALGCLASVVVAQAVGAAADVSYPGAVRLQTEFVDPDLIETGALSRQAIYQTLDNRQAVTQWYAERLHVSPASNQILTGGDCTQLSQSELLVWTGHTVVVNLCETQPGTRIVVNEKLRLWP